jgi:hypothetical protein
MAVFFCLAVCVKRVDDGVQDVALRGKPVWLE